MTTNDPIHPPEGDADEHRVLRRALAALGEELHDGALDEPSQAAMRATLLAFRERRSAAGRSPHQSWWEGLRAAVAELVFDSRTAAPATGWRSDGPAAGDTVTVCFECETARIDVQAALVDEGRWWKLRGQVVLSDGAATDVRLRRVEGDEAALELDGDAFLARVAPGRYDVVVEIDDGVDAVRATIDLDVPGVSRS